MSLISSNDRITRGCTWVACQHCA